jgi:hypothetical protein
VLTSLKKYFNHWWLIFVIALVFLPAHIIASHGIKLLLQSLKVDPLDREIFDFVSLYLTVVDVILILSTATIGALRLLEAEVEE